MDEHLDVRQIAEFILDGLEDNVGLLRFRGQVDYAFRLALMSLRSYSMGLMLPSVE